MNSKLNGCFLLVLLILSSGCGTLTKMRYSHGFKLEIGGKHKWAQSTQKVAKQRKLKVLTLKPMKDIAILGAALKDPKEDTVLYIENKANTLKEIKQKKAITPSQFVCENEKEYEAIKELGHEETKSTQHKVAKAHTFDLLGILWKILKFLIFVVLAIAVFLLVAFATAIVIVSAFAAPNAWPLILILCVLAAILGVFLLGLVYQLFGYGPASDVYYFFSNMFGD